MSTYFVNLALLYKTGEGLRETSVTKIFIAENLIDAIEQASYFFNRWEKMGKVRPLLPGKFISVGAMKLYNYFIDRIKPDGFCETSVSFCPIFEWKCDLPGSLEECIANKKERAKCYI
jgi:hypothetical protein